MASLGLQTEVYEGLLKPHHPPFEVDDDMSSERLPLLSFRLESEELAGIDTLAKFLGCSRSEAARRALRVGLPLARAGHSIDVRRLILLLEYTQAAVDLIVHREHGDLAPGLEQVAHQRMEEFHAPR